MNWVGVFLVRFDGNTRVRLGERIGYAAPSVHTCTCICHCACTTEASHAHRPITTGTNVYSIGLHTYGYLRVLGDTFGTIILKTTTVLSVYFRNLIEQGLYFLDLQLTMLKKLWLWSFWFLYFTSWFSKRIKTPLTQTTKNINLFNFLCLTNNIDSQNR